MEQANTFLFRNLNAFFYNLIGYSKKELLSGNGSSTEISSLPSEMTSVNGSSSSSLVHRKKTRPGHSSPPQVTNMAHLINTRKEEIDRAPLIPSDETRHYSYEGK